MSKLNLLSSQARIQVPWVKVTIGSYTFGVFSKSGVGRKDDQGFYQAYDVQYPNLVQSLNIVKINGQVNQYTLTIAYPVAIEDDPNFFEKVLSSVSGTRKIVFSYGDAAMPSYIYKDEEAIITNVVQSFNFGGSGTISSVINYTIYAVSGSALAKSGSYTFSNSPTKKIKPSDEIKRIFRDNEHYGLQDLFYGMPTDNAGLSALIDGGDQGVILETKVGISALDYINYLVGCMIPAASTTSNISSAIWILTLHDDTTYDNSYDSGAKRPIVNGRELVGPYFKVSRTDYLTNKSDAYEIDIGINTSAIVTSFNVKQNENYAILFDYQGELATHPYRQSINNFGEIEQVYAPGISSQNPYRLTTTADIVWWTKVTKYPISATLTVQGLLRPAQLMTYVRLNVIFPGGKKHITSGLYIVTKQTDQIDYNGYRTTLELTKIAGDDGKPITTDKGITNDYKSNNNTLKRKSMYSTSTVI